ncbi:hypothetical protein ACH5RR_012927 [Cinchona calisaya]|uniref:Uncharacterized protein n=1 Tax=Cinchona calisaya TaxID=153742 RepID=A0ABD2ZYL1_9GENT
MKHRRVPRHFQGGFSCIVPRKIMGTRLWCQVNAQSLNGARTGSRGTPGGAYGIPQNVPTRHVLGANGMPQRVHTGTYDETPKGAEALPGRFLMHSSKGNYGHTPLVPRHTTGHTSDSPTADQRVHSGHPSAQQLTGARANPTRKQREHREFATEGAQVCSRSQASLRLQKSRVLRCGKGRDESKRQRAESQRIVAARPLCPLQYPVAYLSRLQRILPAARWELYFKAADAALPPRGLSQRHVPLGARGPYCGSVNGRRAHASLLARILT